MSWLDGLKKQVLDTIASHAGGHAPETDAPADAPGQAGGLFDGVVAMVRDRGLGSLRSVFEQHGLREVFASWVSKGSNLPISPEQLQKVLGPDTIAALARKFGFSTAQTSAMLSQVLPQLVDQMTPEGQIEEPPAEAPAPDAAPESGHF